MLSILIPTFEYSIFSLVQKLHKQAEDLDIVFEILVYDDCSKKRVAENEEIQRLPFVTYKVLDKNIGRSAIRNLLAKEAKYDYLLFLDADVNPKEEDFLKKYIEYIEKNPDDQIVYGGILYQEETPKPEQMLRWVYGKSREALPVIERRKKPYLSFLTLNFLIKKEVFKEVQFNEDIPNVRYEDILFSYDLKQKRIQPKHIENPVYHLGIETSAVFLEKTKQSLKGLRELTDSQYLPAEYVKLSNKSEQLKTYHLDKVVYFFYKKLRKIIEKNLISQSPNMFWFDFYRLGFYMSEKQK